MSTPAVTFRGKGEAADKGDARKVQWLFVSPVFKDFWLHFPTMEEQLREVSLVFLVRKAVNF